MKDHMHRIAALAGIVMMLGLAAYEVSALVRLRSGIERDLEAAKGLAAAVEENDQPPPVRDSSRYAGRVFAAWENLPPCRDLEPWHFYPTSPARPRR